MPNRPRMGPEWATDRQYIDPSRPESAQDRCRIDPGWALHPGVSRIDTRSTRDRARLNFKLRLHTNPGSTSYRPRTDAGTSPEESEIDPGATPS